MDSTSIGSMCSDFVVILQAPILREMLAANVPQLTSVDFLEALARLACAIPIPSDNDMKQVEVMTCVDVVDVVGL